MVDIEKYMYGTMCQLCYANHCGCVMAFFVGLYEAQTHVDGPVWRDGYLTGEAEGYEAGYRDGESDSPRKESVE